MDTRTNKADTVLVPGTIIIVLKVLAMSTHIHIKNSRLHVSVSMLHGNHGLFDGVHATNSRAVSIAALMGVARAHTLQPGNLFGFFAVIGAHEVTHIRTGGAQYPLKFHAGDHIGRLRIAVRIKIARIIDLVTHGQDHCADFYLRFFGLIIISNCFGQTDLFAKPATDAQIPIDGIGERYGLGVSDGSGCPQIETAVIFIYTVYGTGLTALTAPGAHIRVNIARIVP